jgi:AcrR family transcriptional regulator
MNPDKRTQILSTAKKRFERFGFNKTTVDEIAKDVGISKRTLYQGFGKKEEILEELFMFEALSVRKAILNQIKKVKEPKEKLETYLKLVKKYFDKNPFICNVLNDQSGFFRPFLKDKPHVVEEGIEEIIVNILKEGMSKGVFRKMDEQIIGYSIFLLCKGFTYGKQKSDDQFRVSQISQLINFVIEGILTDKPKH